MWPEDSKRLSPVASNDELHQGFGEQSGVSSVISQATPHTLKPILEPEAENKDLPTRLLAA